MKLQPDLQDEDAYQQWFDEHVNAWVNVAGPLLGAPGTLRSVVRVLVAGCCSLVSLSLTHSLSCAAVGLHVWLANLRDCNEANGLHVRYALLLRVATTETCVTHAAWP